MIHRSLAFTSLLLLTVGGGGGPRGGPIASGSEPGGRAPSPVLTAMQQELARSMETLKTRPLPAYFLSYEINDLHSVSVQGAFGTISSSRDSRYRQLGVDLRVGSSRFDNTHAIRGGMPSFDFSDRYTLPQVQLYAAATPIRR